MELLSYALGGQVLHPSEHNENKMKEIRAQHRTILIIVAFSYFALALYPLITNKALGGGDDRHNSLMAFNLSQYGVISLSEADRSDPDPSNYREPLPAVGAATIMQAYKIVDGYEFSVDALNSGDSPRILKLANLLWAILCLAAVWLLTSELTQSFYLALLASVTTNYMFVSQASVIDTLYSELPTAALLMLAAWALVRAVDRKQRKYFALSGFLAGLLALTKAPFFYISIGLVSFFLVLALIRNRKKLMKHLGLSLIVFFVTVSPWMIRNYTNFGKFEITQRGGVILMIRATNDLMSPEEMKGSIYYWAPGWIRNKIIGEFWNFTRKDFELGGSMQRLNRDILEINKEAERNGKPEDAISFYHKARAERVRLRKYYAQLGEENPSHLADIALQREAVEIILNNPVRHIVMTIPFTWRGIWDLSFRNLPGELSDLLNLVLFTGLVLGMPLLAWRSKDPKLLAFLLLPVAMLAFYAFFSHNIVRYTRPSYPAKIVSLFILGYYFYKSKFIDSRRSSGRHS